MKRQHSIISGLDPTGTKTDSPPILSTRSQGSSSNTKNYRQGALSREFASGCSLSSSKIRLSQFLRTSRECPVARKASIPVLFHCRSRYDFPFIEEIAKLLR